jgi:hypothetical protein
MLTFSFEGHLDVAALKALQNKPGDGEAGAGFPAPPPGEGRKRQAPGGRAVAS